MPIPNSIHNLCDLLNRAAKNRPEKIALRDRENDGYSQWSYAQFSTFVYSFARRLQSENIEKNKPIGLLIPNSKWWGLAFFAALACDAVVVPIDVRLGAEETNAIINAAGIKLLIAADIYQEKTDKLSAEKIIPIDISNNGNIFLENIKRYNSSPIKNNNLRIHNAIIIFTSGTTGKPKGVPLTHGNLLADIFDMLNVLEISENESFVSILPLNHVFEITGGFLSPIALNARITYTRSLRPDLIFKTISDSQMTVMMVVPSFLKSFLSRIKKKSAENLGKKFNILFSLSIFLNKINISAGKFIFKNIRKALSENLKGFVCGGAPIDADIISELNTLGFSTLQGYGLTETAPVIAVNTFNNNRVGSVGKKLPNVELKINSTDETGKGELLARGAMIFNGYFNDGKTTADAFYKDWFKTGDLAKVDKDGYFYIIGRIKSIIVTAGGKNIYPEYVERFLKKSDAVAEACLIGLPEKSGAEKPVAVIALKKENTKSETEVISELKLLLESISEYQRPKKIIFLENLPMTSSMKVKREELREIVLSQVITAQNKIE